MLWGDYHNGEMVKIWKEAFVAHLILPSSHSIKKPNKITKFLNNYSVTQTTFE